MKSLQNQYNLISEGKGKKDVFLKEAKRLYPNLLTNSSNFNEAEAILKNKGVISENIVGIPAIGSLKDSSKKDWIKIFKESINENQMHDELLKLVMRYVEDPDEAADQAEYIITSNLGMVDDMVQANLERDPDYKNWAKRMNAAQDFEKSLRNLNESLDKEVEDINAHGYDNADKKNLDNQIFDQYLNGLYVELKKDPELTMEKAREIVAKNLASDPIYYTKNAAFKVDGIGYTDEAPGLTPKEITGKYKASGYGDLKEQKLRKAIRSIIKEELTLDLMHSSSAKDLFDYFKKEDLIDDRAEYSLEDLMNSYPGLSKIEAQKLMKMLSQV